MTYRPDGVILVVEDDPNDQIFVQRAFKQLGSTGTRMAVVENGTEATAYLEGRDRFSDRAAHPLPRLIITDLKMPKMSGIDLLMWLAGRSDYAHIPVVVLTSSSDQTDIAAAYAYGAKGYMIKPVAFGELETIVRIVDDYWRISQVPPLRT